MDARVASVHVISMWCHRCYFSSPPRGSVSVVAAAAAAAAAGAAASSECHPCDAVMPCRRMKAEERAMEQDRVRQQVGARAGALHTEGARSSGMACMHACPPAPGAGPALPAGSLACAATMPCLLFLLLCTSMWLCSSSARMPLSGLAAHQHPSQSPSISSLDDTLVTCLLAVSGRSTTRPTGGSCR